MTPMSRRSIATKLSLASIFALASTTGLANAAASGTQTLAQLEDMPRWPIYAAMVIGLIIACHRFIHHLKTRKSKAKIFPKLTLRRRLYAPYSGGNDAKISFAPRRDA